MKMVGSYCVYIILSPAAKTVEDRPSSCFERLGHLVEPVKGDKWCAKPAHVVAVVVFEIVDAPGSKALRILCLVVERSSIACTRELSGTRIHAEQQIFVVQSVGHSEHAVWELGLVDYEVAIVATSTGPAVVEDDIVVAQIPQPVVYQQLGSLEQQILGDIAGERVPVVLS